MLLWLLSLQLGFSLVSPFPSQVEGLDIPNSHIIEDQAAGVLVRGMRPRTEKDLNQLLEIGITDVLIFKDSNTTDTSTEEEINHLKAKGISNKRIHVIPFKWKDIDSFETACLQTLEAIEIMKKVAASENRNLFVHCTVGEDRTGYLSAIYKILFHDKKPETAWKEDMCENGYANGNPRKPKFVVDEIHKNISPVFQKMLHKIKLGYISKDNLDRSECSFDPERSSQYQPLKAFTNCKASSNYDPTIR
jgi:hypothetical protein